MRLWLNLMMICWGGAVGAQQVNCVNPQSQAEMNICAAQDYERSDARLNAAWKIVKPQFDSMGLGAALLDSQRKWLAYRDAACAAETSQFAGGTIAPLVRNSCLQTLTDRRTDDLNALRN